MKDCNCCCENCCRPHQQHKDKGKVDDENKEKRGNTEE